MDCVGNKQFTLDDVIDFFECRINGLSKSTKNAYHKAFSSLRCFIACKYSSVSAITLELLENWYVDMRFQGLSYKTAAYYIDNISSLYNAAVKSGVAKPSDSFKIIKSNIKKLDAEKIGIFVKEVDFRRLLKIAEISEHLDCENSVIRDIILFSLVNGCMPISEVVFFQKMNVNRLNNESQIIANRNIDVRRKYVFALGQTIMAKRQLEARVSKDIMVYFRTHNLPVMGNVEDSMKSLWAFVAIRCGASASLVVESLGSVPAGMSILSICTNAKAEESEKKLLVEAVAKFLFKNSLQWFAMRLRPKVRYDQIQDRFSAIADIIRTPKMFYPCQEIVMRVGKKMVRTKKPIIRDIVFFQSRMTEIYKMFNYLADLAWCYKSNNSQYGHYAVISQSSMDRFQEAIGKFTSEYEIAPMGKLPLSPEDRIVVIGGDYVGYNGTFMGRDTNLTDDGHTVYRIMILGDACKWNIGIDARLIRPI